MKYGSPEHNEECAKRSFLEFSKLEIGKVYSIDANKGDVVAGIPPSEVFFTLEEADAADVGYEPQRWEIIPNCSLVMFVESKKCFSFNSNVGTEMHYRFLLGDREFWLCQSIEGKYGFFFHDAEWVALTESEEFKSSLQNAIDSMLESR